MLKYKIIILLSTLFIVTINNSSNIIIGNNSKNNLFQKLLPQGWSFFTKSPRSEDLIVYKLNKNTFELLTRKNMSQDNFYGLSRFARRLGYESSLLTQNIGKDLWIDKTITDISEFVISEEKSVCINGKISMPVNVKQFEKGIYLLIVFKPISWFYFSCNSCKNSYQIKYVTIEL